MKGVVVYDSYFGNTKTVAEAIAEQLRAEGWDTELRSVRERGSAPPQGDIMFVGSPVRMGSVTGRMKRYVKRLDEDAWRGRPIVVFTTILQLPENATDAQLRSHEDYDIGAGRKLRDLARSRGLDAVEDHLWVGVEGMKGPLIETGVRETRRFTHGILAAPAGG
jgi:flavodoxin